MQACLAWASAARALGTPVVLDGGSWKAGTDRLLNCVDTAICSADFLPPGCAGEDDVLPYLQRAGVGQIAVTHGAGRVRYSIFGNDVDRNRNCRVDFSSRKIHLHSSQQSTVFPKMP
jgi:sugar/nucleoside kinase (ribokinase family)